MSEARPFRVHSEFAPAGDQPAAIEQLVDGVDRGERFQTLLGISEVPVRLCARSHRSDSSARKKPKS